MERQKPPRWTRDALAAELAVAIALFRQERVAEPLERYLRLLAGYEANVTRLLEATDDLRDLGRAGGGARALLDPRLGEALRYALGPPISADDLLVVAQVPSLAPRPLQTDPELLERLLGTIILGLDARRFPWLAEQRPPTVGERHVAIISTAILMATQRLATHRRTESKTAQERRVREALVAQGFREVPTRSIGSIAAAPRPGELCGECKLGSRKADLVVGLWDGRVLPIECKVSNSATNSIKRLNNDAAAKAETWRAELGTLQVVPTAVLSGVYGLGSLEAAQERGLTLFWAHRLERMTEWIESTRE